MKRTLRTVFAAALCVLFQWLHVARAADTASPTRVYRCVHDGTQVFSDQPCGKDAQQHTVTVTNRMDEYAVRDSSRKASPAERQRVGRDDRDDRDDANEQRCIKIGASKHDLDQRMRAGYNAAQGERLRERLRKLNDEYFERRCSRYR